MISGAAIHNPVVVSEQVACNPLMGQKEKGTVKVIFLGKTFQ